MAMTVDQLPDDPDALKAMVVNAGVNLQRRAGAKVQHGRKQEGPRYRGPSCLRPCCTFAPARRCRFTPALTTIAFSASGSSGSWSTVIAMTGSDQIRQRRATAEPRLIHLVADQPALTGTRVRRAS